MIVLEPIPAALALVVLLLVWAAARSFAWGARVAVFAFPVILLALEPKERVGATGALMTFIGLRFAQAALERRRIAPQ